MYALAVLNEVGEVPPSDMNPRLHEKMYSRAPI